MDPLEPIKFNATALHGQIQPRRDLEPAVLRVTRNPHTESPHKHALLCDAVDAPSAGFAAYLWKAACSPHRLPANGFCLSAPLSHLADGDIIRINPSRGQLWVMYRLHSPNNSILLTERCNSWCVMCSQPPKLRDDSGLIDDWLEAIPLMSPATQTIGFTGGEPTLLGDRFLQLVYACRNHLPEAGLHILSNGRMFNYLQLAKQLGDLRHPDLMIGIPLYSDIAWRHDCVVQAPGAFDQTIRGIMNLARCCVRTEIRVVLHRLTVDRLPNFATFIARNLPFVEHVALMGYEPIGFGRTNLDALWIDPVDYQQSLAEAVAILATHRMSSSIYNHQLCVLPESLWPYARHSISDWKNVYLPICQGCKLRADCGGFFHSAIDAHSKHITPFTPSSPFDATQLGVT